MSLSCSWPLQPLMASFCVSCLHTIITLKPCQVCSNRSVYTALAQHLHYKCMETQLRSPPPCLQAKTAVLAVQTRRQRMAHLTGRLSCAPSCNNSAGAQC